MRFLSVCSGIEAASVGWRPLGWRAVAFSEIEPFPCAVLAHHYPGTPNWGDMTKFKDWPDADVDLLCGGTPCQSFSIAGLRKGLDDPRGNLMLTFGAVAAKYRPQWLVWENVPGVLSSNGGRDFGAFLGMLGQLGYGFAYRILDAQFFGVPQRRRRVFVVGCLGDWRSAAAVLFERHSLSGHSAPRRQTREGVAGGVARSLAIRGRDGTPQAELGDEVANALLTPNGGRAGIGIGAIMTETLCIATGQAGAETGADMAPALNCNHEAPYIAHSLRGEGFDASEDGTGRGTPLVPVVVDYTNGILTPGGPVGTLEAAQSKGNRGLGILAFDCKASGQRGFGVGEIASVLRAMGHANNHSNGGGHQAVVTGMQARRLTPRECERLQGFPDDYTSVPYHCKPAADGLRYKALGNSWAVPVAHWVGRRIAEMETIAAVNCRKQPSDMEAA